MQELTDTQNEKDDRNLPIDQVGVKNLSDRRFISNMMIVYSH